MMKRARGVALFMAAVVLAATAIAQTEAGAIEATGTFKPAGPPEQPSRTQVGDSCIVDLQQRYTVEGTLSGTMRIDYRIFVAGPCGAPPGTYDEHWIAYGRYSVDLGHDHLEGALVDLARVQAGGDVEGSLTLADGLEGTLHVHGNFHDGFMHYQGSLQHGAAD